MELRWLDPAGQIDGKSQGTFTLQPGDSAVPLKHPLCDSCDPLVERLEYTVSPTSINYRAFAPVSGRLSLPNIARYAFALGVVTSGFPAANQPFELRVLASHPLTREPVAGVAVKAGAAAAVTGTDGVAVLRVVRSRDDNEGTIEVLGRLGDFSGRGATGQLPMRKDEFHAYTDKPIYQPGQTMHVRVLVFGADGRAAEGRDLDLRIEDESGELNFNRNLKTSRFGIASADWEIPQQAEAGKYDISVKTGEDDRRVLRQVSIRSYELPSFRVTAAAERAFYLVNETAQVQVRGDFLFGKPVTGGIVRVVAAEDEEKAVAEGVLDGQGRFRAALHPKVSLTDYQLFADRQYIAFVTDPSTNRTEQRKFDIRISREAVHVYAVRLERSEMGRRLFVTTFSPDGTPLRSDVSVVRGEVVAGRSKTNRFGVARIDLAAPGDDWAIVAVTADGARAQIRLPSPVETPGGVWFTTDRSLYHEGQAVKCAIGGTAGQTALVIASNESGSVVFSRSVRLDNGRVSLEIPYDKRFGRALHIGVVSAADRGVVETRRVYFPGPGALTLKATPGQATYRPGENATIQFQASAQAALGVAIVDQSVLERASTDAAFGGRRRWFDDSGEEKPSLGGITEDDLLHLDAARIDDPELQLVAEVLSADSERMLAHSTDDPAGEIRRTFETQAAVALAPVKRAIDEFYLDHLEFPRDQASLERIAGYALRSANDPWLRPFYSRFSIEGADAVVRIYSDGPDKKAGTADDLTGLTMRRKWFAPQASLMRAAQREFPDYPASVEEFARRMETATGIRFEALRDPWGSAMRLELGYTGRLRTFRLMSAGPDRTFGTADDFTVTEFSGFYFRALEQRIERLLGTGGQEFPASADEFRSLLARNGIDFDSLRDPWGRPYSIALRDQRSFTDQVEVYTYAEYNHPPEDRKQITPVRQTIRLVEIRSDGTDGVRRTYDDFAVATFARVLREPERPLAPAPPAAAPVVLDGTGVIAGIVLDQTGAVVPDAEVKLNDQYVARSDQDGKFVFTGLPPAKYWLSCNVPGFQKSVMEAVPVSQGSVTRVQLTLRVGTMAEMVTVEAAPLPLNVDSASMASIRSGLAAQAAIATPRVREYFPETLYWEPDLITDNAGRATLRVKLADSITTWRVAVLGTTIDGRMAEANVDLRAFQPFQVDLDVPPVLTAGDELTLAVPVRNYLNRAQKVTVSVKTPAELRLITPVAQPRGAVEANASTTLTVGLRAEAAAKAALLQVTATGSTASDAIRKPAAIHPDGERRTTVVSSVVSAGETLTLAVPERAIAGSIRGQVKLYPSILARILEALEVLLESPHGCAEQTISSTYPSLMLLQALKDAGIEDGPLSDRAMRYLRSGYRRLLSYQSADGAFMYWGHGDTNVALTSYALTFLADARAWIEIDDDVVKRARAWLSKQPAADPATNALRVQAIAARMVVSREADLDLQLGAMARKASEYNDPYALAAYALAVMEAGKTELAGPVIDQLRRAARDERGAAFWSLRANTPFYGWGRSGQIETTALAVTALARWRKAGHADDELNRLIERGVMFLLRNTAHGGAWATSQATARALMALLEAETSSRRTQAAEVEVRVNGARAGRVTIPSDRQLNAPLLVDVSAWLRASDNAIQLTGFAPRAEQVQIAAEWYEAWGRPAQPAGDLEMQVRFSKVEAAVNDPLWCDAVISRPAFRGYGMMIANIGLPPGAEVDRGVLEEIVDDGKNGVDAYEVAPDHVTFYVWPRAADVKFRFLFRPRLAMKAKAAQSTLYDFYNPDSRVVVAPAVFTVTTR